MKPAVILVGADKGGVGKTTVARTLLDYFAANNILARAFDTEWPRGTLKRFQPGITEIVDMTSTRDQMRILDTLHGSGPKVSVLDVRAGQLSATLRALRDIGFLDAVRDDQFTLVLFHILGPSIASLDEIAEIAPFFKDGDYFLVKNFINETTFFEWDPQTYASYFNKVKHSGSVTIPKLNEMAYEQVELSGVPFSSFVENQSAEGDIAKNSFVLRGYVRTWMRNIAAEFDRIDLLGLLGSKPAKK